MSLLPPQENRQYGMFGYAGTMCDNAIRADNPAMLQECIDRGWIDADTQLLMGGTVLEFCDKKGFSKCADLLRSHKAAA